MGPGSLRQGSPEERARKNWFKKNVAEALQAKIDPLAVLQRTLSGMGPVDPCRAPIPSIQLPFPVSTSRTLLFCPDCLLYLKVDIYPWVMCVLNNRQTP